MALFFQKTLFSDYCIYGYGYEANSYHREYHEGDSKYISFPVE